MIFPLPTPDIDDTVAFALDTYIHVVFGLQEAAAKVFDDSLNNLSENKIKDCV